MPLNFPEQTVDELCMFLHKHCTTTATTATIQARSLQTSSRLRNSGTQQPFFCKVKQEEYNYQCTPSLSCFAITFKIKVQRNASFILSQVAFLFVQQHHLASVRCLAACVGALAPPPTGSGLSCSVRVCTEKAGLCAPPVW